MMAAMTIRNIPDAVHEALKARAKRNGRSAESEARAILDEVLTSSGDAAFGTWLQAMGPAVWDDDVEVAIAGIDDSVERPSS